MPAVIPHRFLVRLAHPCPRVPDIPADTDADALFDLPDSAALRNFTELDGGMAFADVRLAWNEFGIAVQLTVSDKKQAAEGDLDKPKASDGLTLWLDTRDSRAGHRATRTCHQFHFLPAGGGTDKDAPAFAQTKINRALQDAPVCDASQVPFRCHFPRGGYRIEAFLPTAVLTGFDPDQHPRLGVYYHLRDRELGDQYLGVNAEFPFADDPSLWEVLELMK